MSRGLGWPGLGVLLGLAMVSPGSARSQPVWTIAQEAKDSLAALWSRSVATRREEVACLGGAIDADTVRVLAVLGVGLEQADSLTAEAERSLAECGPPKWVGTVHTHIRATDGSEPAPRFSPSDRVVMSLWSSRWGRAGAFCVLYSEKQAHCELYPPRSPAR